MTAVDGVLVAVCVLALFGLWRILVPRKRFPPGGSESVAAGCWLILRRIACFVFGIFLAMGALFYGMELIQGAPLLSSLAAIVGFLVASVWVFWIGVYGTSSDPWTFDADEVRQLHAWRKKRYGWGKSGRKPESGAGDPPES